MKNLTKNEVAIVWATALVAIAFTVAAWWPSQSVDAAPVPAPVPAAVAANKVDYAAPSHNYVLEEDGEYGYEAALSQDDRNAGHAAKGLKMLRYLGQREDGTYTAVMVSGAFRTTLSCKDPCAFIKQSITFNGESMGKPETFRAGNNLATAVLDDAVSGELKVYGAKKAARVAPHIAKESGGETSSFSRIDPAYSALPAGSH